MVLVEPIYNSRVLCFTNTNDRTICMYAYVVNTHHNCLYFYSFLEHHKYKFGLIIERIIFAGKQCCYYQNTSRTFFEQFFHSI